MNRSPSVSEPLPASATAIASWVLEQLPPSPTILEVGAGDGAMASILSDRGARVIAIEPNADRAKACIERGITCICASYPDCLSQIQHSDFDAVFFGRVLHHIEDLDGALVGAKRLLNAQGILIADEFAWEDASPKMAAWIHGLISVGLALEVVPADIWDVTLGPEDCWAKVHTDHGVHTGHTMMQALAVHFELLTEERVPYMFRNLEGYLAGSEIMADAAESLYRIESRLISEGEIEALGLRIVARPKKY